MTERLSTQGIRSGYGELTILWDIDVVINSGERVLLMGANGAGKTTLLKTIGGLLSTSKGKIVLQNEEVQSWPINRRIRHGMAYVSETGIIKSLSIEENLVIGGFWLGKKALRDAMALAYDRFAVLKDRRLANAGSLSGGQRKMLAVAKALMSNPQLLIMDEPSQGLSPLLTQEIVQLLKGMHNDGLAYFIAEQNTQFLDLADKVYVLDSGRIRFEGTPKELESNDTLRQTYFGLA